MYICSVKKIMNRHDYRIDFNVQSKAMLSIWRKNEVFFEAFTFYKIVQYGKIINYFDVVAIICKIVSTTDKRKGG